MRGQQQALRGSDGLALNNQHVGTLDQLIVSNFSWCNPRRVERKSGTTKVPKTKASGSEAKDYNTPHGEGGRKR